jgi:hypothetical protein
MSGAMVCDCCGAFCRAPKGSKRNSARSQLPDGWLRLEYQVRGTTNTYGHWTPCRTVELCEVCIFEDPRHPDPPVACPHKPKRLKKSKAPKK